jgi:hypothetical protein
MNGYDLGNQSRGGDRSSCRRSTIALTGTEISEFFIVECALQRSRSPTTIWPRIWLGDLMRSAAAVQCGGGRSLDSMALIRSTSLARSYLRISFRICVLSVKEVAERFSSLGPLGTVEHPINQVLKFGLSSNAFANEVV